MVVREIDRGEVHVAAEAAHVGTDTTPLRKGFPDDRCQCPHWGYLLEGQVHVDYPDREETIDAGESYYLRSGHHTGTTAESGGIEFSPKEAHRETMAVMVNSFEEMRQEP